MARKSRKNINLPSVEEVSTPKYSVAAYIRLSVIDNSKNTDSIHLQQKRIVDYIDNNNELELYSIYEDNGATGTNFERVGFQRMIEDVKSKKVNCIIVKDLSRFGRDHIETGNYIEKIFPFLGVRFISIADNFDTFDAEKSEDGYLIPLKNLINEIYAKDISKKIEIQKTQMMKKGEYAGGIVLYGYKRSVSNVRKLEVDENVSNVIRRIFKMRADGCSYTFIAKKLTSDNITSPSMYKFQSGVVKSKKFEKAGWSTMYIKRILSNPMYTGNMVQGKTKQSVYRGEKVRKVSEDEYFVVNNTHEGLVSQELFDIIQAINKKSQENHAERLSKNAHIDSENILKGIIFCGKCGSKLYSNRMLNSNSKAVYNYYFCWKNQYKYQFENPCTEYKRAHKEDILIAVETTLKAHSKQLVLTITSLRKFTQSKEYKGIKLSRNQEIKDVKSEITQKNIFKQKLLENYLKNVIQERDYLHFSQVYDDEIKRLQTELDNLFNQDIADNRITSKIYWVELFEKFLKEQILNSEIAKLLIERVIVNNPKDIEIVFKYKDEYESLLLKAKEYGVIVNAEI